MKQALFYAFLFFFISHGGSLFAVIEDHENLFSPHQREKIIEAQNKLYTEQKVDSLIITYQSQRKKDAGLNEWQRRRETKSRPSLLLLVSKDQSDEIQAHFRKGSTEINKSEASKTLKANIQRSSYISQDHAEACQKILEQFIDDYRHLSSQALSQDEEPDLFLVQKIKEFGAYLKDNVAIITGIIATAIVAFIIHGLLKRRRAKKAYYFPDVKITPRMGGPYSGGAEVIINSQDPSLRH